MNDTRLHSGTKLNWRTLLRAWGIDRAIAFTVLGRGWAILSGPVNLFFVVKFLSLQEQGFYYTFANIVGLQIFFELGLAGVILQFASHERARLEWAPDGTLFGDETAKARLAALLHKTLRWYGVVSALVIGLVLPAGFWFFGRHQPAHERITWQWPWMWIVLMEACSMLSSPIFALLQGCGLVAEVAVMRLWQSVAVSLLLWLALSQHWGLFSAPFCGTIGLIGALVWLARSKGAFLADMLAWRGQSNVLDWRREIWPFQWKIAVSWLSGYFTANLFNPILFAFYGAAAAGRMGMSLSLAMAIWTTAFAWVNTKAAPFGILIAKKEWQELDRVFFPCMWQAVLLAAGGGTVVWLGVLYLHLIHHRWSERLLDLLPLGLLMMTIVISQIIASQAVYLRSHKQEPFVGISILSGCLIGGSAYVLGRWFGATGMMAGYFGTHVLLLVLSTRIFMQKRRLWHGEVA